MSKERPSTKTCKHCKTEIPFSAKVCPQCRKKQGGAGCLTAIIIVVALGILSSCFAGNNNKLANSTPKSESNKEGTSKAPVEKTTEAPIEYIAYTVDDMMEDLKANALNASEKYKNQYVEVTGKLSNIDSSGKYIDLAPINSDFAIIGIQCYIKDDDQKNKVMEMSIGDTVTLKGKITKVGEILGYSLNITEIN
jgi:lysyl-tRNA synthetase class II